MNIKELPTKNWIWISWEDHRRTRELCKAFNILLFKKNLSLPRFLGHPFLIIWTFSTLLRLKPKGLIVQNPSIFLALEAVFLQKILSYSLVIDSHNAALEPILSNGSKITQFLYGYVQRKAQLSLVTNQDLANCVKSIGGTPFILEDKVPTFTNSHPTTLKGQVNIACISTFADDEPIAEIIQAVRILNKNWYVYMTGNSKKLSRDLANNLPSNLVLTGFLSNEDYLSLLQSVDIILDLTTRENCLVCGAYEAIGLGKPAILSDHMAIRNYFSKGVLLTKNQPIEIKSSLEKAERQLEHLQKETIQLKKELDTNWNLKREKLYEIFQTLRQDPLQHQPDAPS